MKRVYWGLLSALLIFCLILVGCSSATVPATSPSTTSPATSQATGNAPATIKIGAVASITGGDASNGIPTQFAYQLAIDDINKSGGVFVKAYNKKIPLELDLRDGQTDPEKVMAAAAQVNADGCPVAVGANLGGIAAGSFEQNKLPYVVCQFTANSMSQQGFKYFFNTDKMSSGLAAAVFALIDSLPKANVPTKWAFLEEQADWIAEVVGFMKQESGKRGITVSYEGQYQMLAPDMSQLILGAKNSGAEVVFACPTTPDGITLLKQMAQLNYHPKAIIFFRGADDPSWGDLGVLGNYIIGSPQWTAGLNFKDPRVQALVAAWKTKSGKDGGNPSIGPAYATIQIVAAAIEKAGSLDRNAIRDAIAATDLTTVIGPVKFDATGVMVNAPLTVYQWQDGVMQLVWPIGPNNNTKPVIWPIP